MDTRPGATKENIRQEPVIVNYIREYQLSHGVPHAQVYTITMYILAGILVIGLICNILVRPVANK